MGRDKEAFYKDCAERAANSLGSSHEWKKETVFEEGFPGGDPTRNPNFYNWEHFIFPYCDGTGFGGHITDSVEVDRRNIFFRGHSNAMEGFDYVFDKIKIDIPNVKSRTYSLSIIFLK